MKPVWRCHHHGIHIGMCGQHIFELIVMWNILAQAQVLPTGNITNSGQYGFGVTLNHFCMALANMSQSNYSKFYSFLRHKFSLLYSVYGVTVQFILLLRFRANGLSSFVKFQSVPILANKAYLPSRISYQ